MTLFNFFLENPSNYILYLVWVGFSIFGIFLAANHTWIAEVEGEETEVGLILWTMKKRINRIAKKADQNGYLGLTLALGILSTVVFLCYQSVVHAINTGDSNYYYGLFGLIGLLALGKKFEYLSDMFLACYRCMPTAWIGLPLVAYSYIQGFYVNPVFLQNLPFVVGTIAFVSFISTMSYMVYTKYKVAIDMLVREKQIYIAIDKAFENKPKTLDNLIIRLGKAKRPMDVKVEVPIQKIETNAPAPVPAFRPTQEVYPPQPKAQPKTQEQVRFEQHREPERINQPVEPVANETIIPRKVQVSTSKPTGKFNALQGMKVERLK